MAGSSWTNQVQNQVIVTGSNGGVFVYSGTPSLGNPPVAWLTNGGLTDPFGNALPSVTGVQASGSFSAGNTYITASGTVTYSGAPAANNVFSSSAPAQFTDAFGNVILPGTTTYLFSAGVYFALQHTGANIFSYRATSQAGPWTQKTQVNFTTISGAGTGFVTINAPIVAQSGTITDQTVITTDVWNQITPGGTWTNSGAGVNGFFYTLLPDGNVLLAWDVSNNNANPGTLGTLPAAYRPATTVRLASGWTGTGPAAYNSQFAPTIEIHADGTIHGIGLFVATLTLFGTAVLPLGSL